MSCSDELAVHSCTLLCLQRRVAKVASGFFYRWSLLRNNTVATNPQRFTVYYGSRRFVAWDSWTQTSWQVMQWDSDKLIAVSHVHLYFVKRSMSESIAGEGNLFRFACWNRLNQLQNSSACQPKFVRTYYLTSLKVYVKRREEMIQIRPNSENTI